MMVDFILIHKSDLLSIKIEIYYQTIKVITKKIYNHRHINIIDKVLFLCLALETSNWLIEEY